MIKIHVHLRFVQRSVDNHSSAEALWPYIYNFIRRSNWVPQPGHVLYHIYFCES